MGRRPGHPDPRRVPGPQRRAPDRHQDHRLAGPLRGARALHRRRHPRLSRGATRTPRSWPTPSARPRCWRKPTSPARPRRMTDYVGEQQPEAGGADHRVLDGRQRRRRRAGHRVRAPLQPVPAHEADHAGEHLRGRCCTTATRSRSIRPIADARAAGRPAHDRPAAAATPARYDLVKARHHVDVELI